MLLTNGAKDAADGLPPSNDGTGEAATDCQAQAEAIARRFGNDATPAGQSNHIARGSST